MLIFSEQSLAFIAVPKTGTTAIEMALKPRADIIFTKRRKHISAHRFHKKIAPFLETEFGISPDRFAVIREPEEQIRSWYRYRARKARKGTEFSTDGISFDQFVREVISEDPPAHAKIGSQLNMLTSPNGDLLVHHLFTYELPGNLKGFLEQQFGAPVALKEKNVSPHVPADLDPATRKKLRAARVAEFDLYSRSANAGGHLVTQIG